MKIISENTPEHIAKLRAREKAEHAAKTASVALRELIANLFRIVAGAGEPVSLLAQTEQFRSAYVTWLNAAHEVGSPLPNDADVWSGLTLNELFPDERGPQTEQEWREWVSGDPRLEYLRERDREMDDIRQIVLREIAATLSGVTMHSRKHHGDFHMAIQRICDARERYTKEKGRPFKANPFRIHLAEEAIANLKRKEVEDANRAAAELKERRIANLAEHQLRALRAIEHGSAELLAQTDNFTLDVLKSIGLLRREKGIKGKAAWRLTDEGRTALERHES